MKTYLVMAPAVILMATVTMAGAIGAEDPETMMVKPGTGVAQRTADINRCAAVIRDNPVEDMPISDQPVGMAATTGGAGGVGAVAGAAIASIIIGMIEDGRARERGQKFCLYNLGYRELTLTPQESAVHRKLRGDKATEWERDFLASDLDSRYQPLLTPAVPRLPAYREEPHAWGGLTIGAFSLAAGTAREGEDVAVAQARRVRVAALLTPIETMDGPVRVAADPGTVFQQVDYRRQSDKLLRADGATWCGPVRQMAGGNTAKDFFCFTGRDNGYEIYRPSGYAWLAGRYTAGFILPLYTRPIRMEERGDDFGPLDIAIKAVSIGRSSITLAANAQHDGKAVELWSLRLRFDKNGGCILPLWDQALVIRHNAGGMVTVTLGDGDGHDWRVKGD